LPKVLPFKLQATLLLQKFRVNNWIKSINTKNYRTQIEEKNADEVLLISIFFVKGYFIFTSFLQEYKIKKRPFHCPTQRNDP